MRLNYFLFFLLLCGLFMACSNSGGDSPDYKLSWVSYEDFTMYIGTNEGGVSQNYDTIVSNRNIRLQDTTRLYLPAVYTDFNSNSRNSIAFEFFGDNKIMFTNFNERYKLLGDKQQIGDSIFVLKNNSLDTPIFVVNENKEQNEYYRSMSAFRYIYTQKDGERKDSTAIIEGVILDATYLLRKFNLSSMTELPKSDTLIWINVDYIYQ